MIKKNHNTIFFNKTISEKKFEYSFVVQVYGTQPQIVRGNLIVIY